MTFDEFITQGAVSANYCDNCCFEYGYFDCSGYYFNFDDGISLEFDDNESILAFYNCYWIPDYSSSDFFLIIFYNEVFYKIFFDFNSFIINEFSTSSSSTTTSSTTLESKVDTLISNFQQVFSGEPSNINSYFQDNFNALSSKIDNINVDLTPITTQITDLNTTLTDDLNSISVDVLSIEDFLHFNLQSTVFGSPISIAELVNRSYTSLNNRLIDINNDTISIKNLSVVIRNEAYVIQTQISGTNTVNATVTILNSPLTEQLNSISSNLITYKESIENKVDNINLTPITDNLNTLSQNIETYYLNLKSLIAPPEITIKSLNGNFGTYPDGTILNTTTYGNDWLVLGSFITDFNNQAMPMYKLEKNGTIRFTPAYFLKE